MNNDADKTVEPDNPVKWLPLSVSLISAILVIVLAVNISSGTSQNQAQGNSAANQVQRETAPPPVNIPMNMDQGAGQPKETPNGIQVPDFAPMPEAMPEAMPTPVAPQMAPPRGAGPGPTESPAPVAQAPVTDEAPSPDLDTPASAAPPIGASDLPSALSTVADSQGAIGSVSIRWRDVRTRTSEPSTLDDQCLQIMSRAFLKEKPVDLTLAEFKGFCELVTLKDDLVIGFSKSLDKLGSDQVALIKLASAANNKHRGAEKSKEGAAVIQSVYADYRDLCDTVMPGFFQ